MKYTNKNYPFSYNIKGVTKMILKTTKDGRLTGGLILLNTFK